MFKQKKTAGGGLFCLPLISLNSAKEHRLKIFVTLSGFWLLRGVRVLSESVKTEKFVSKILFSDNVE